MQRPDTKDIVDLQFFLFPGKSVDEDERADAADQKSRKRVNQVGTGTDGDQAGQGAVVSKTRVAPGDHDGKDDTADHRHQ